MKMSTSRRRYVQIQEIQFRYRSVRKCLSRSTLKGGPEPLEKEIHKILGSKREDRFSDPFLKLVQKNLGSFFRTCFITVIYVRTRRHCESSRRSARRFVCLFVWVSKTHPITGLSGWRTPDEPLRTQEPVPDRKIGALPSLW